MSWWNFTSNADLSRQIAALRSEVFDQYKQLKGEQKQMAIALSDIAAVEAAERADLATLTGLVSQILTAVANGQMDQTAAQALLDSMNADDASVKSNIASIQAPLTPAPGDATGGPPAA